MISRNRAVRIVGALAVVGLTMATYASTASAGLVVPDVDIRETVDLDYDRTLAGYCESLLGDINEASEVYNNSTLREKSRQRSELNRLIGKWNNICSPSFGLVIAPVV